MNGRELTIKVVNKIRDINPSIQTVIFTDNSFKLHKTYDEDNFFQKLIQIESIENWITLFGLEMTCNDIVNSFLEDLEAACKD